MNFYIYLAQQYFLESSGLLEIIAVVTVTDISLLVYLGE